MKLPETPRVAVDAVVIYRDAFVLINRKNPPLGLALPGGFMDVGETAEDAVRREVKEETNLGCDIIKFIGVYSDPNRDNRGHIITLAYACEAWKDQNPRAQDDAKAIFTLPEDIIVTQGLIADHNKIFEDAMRLVFNRGIY